MPLIRNSTCFVRSGTGNGSSFVWTNTVARIFTYSSVTLRSRKWCRASSAR